MSGAAARTGKKYKKKKRTIQKYGVYGSNRKRTKSTERNNVHRI